MDRHTGSRRTRRQFLAAGALAGGAAFGAGHAFLVAPRDLRVTRISVRIPRLPVGPAVRILHLSDFHVSSVVPFDLIERAIALGLEEKPDLAVLTGDFWSRRPDDTSPLVRALRRLSDAVPCFACAGNHDGGRWVAPVGGYPDLAPLRNVLEQGGVRLLWNQGHTVRAGGRSVELVGLGDLWARECSPATAFANLGAPGGTPRIVLSHNPDSKDLLRDSAWDLMLCGHTHGGQLVVPLLGWRPFAPVRDLLYVEGLHGWMDRQVYTTRGVGNLHGLRINCPPEVSVLEVG